FRGALPSVEENSMGVLKQITTKRFQTEIARCLFACLTLTLLTVICQILHVNLATMSVLSMAVVVLLSIAGTFASTIAASLVSVFWLMYLAAPTWSFKVDDPFDVIAIMSFMTVAVVVGRLVSRLRTMAEEAISSVDRRLVEAEDRERSWIARELHDNVNQRLALVAAGLGVLHGRVSDIDNAARQQVEQLREQLCDVGTDIQSLSRHLHSTKLQLLGIVTSTKSLCRELSDKHGLEIQVHCEGVPKPLPEHVSLTLFRVLQEALQNAVKH